MTTPATDTRSAARRLRDEQIASEAPLPHPDIPAGTVPTLVESHLARLGHRPLAVVGIVENGLVRPLDSTVKLAEHSRVIIVAAEG